LVMFDPMKLWSGGKHTNHYTTKDDCEKHALFYVVSLDICTQMQGIHTHLASWLYEQTTCDSLKCAFIMVAVDCILSLTTTIWFSYNARCSWVQTVFCQMFWSHD
jgi:hypothetical protein